MKNWRCKILAQGTLLVLACLLPSATQAGDLPATPATLEKVFASAQGGDTILLGAGNYGRFKGGLKSGVVTLRAQAGATAPLEVNFNPASNITIDGVTVAGAHVMGASRHITFTHVLFTKQVTFRDGTGPMDVLFDRCTWGAIDSVGYYEGRLSVVGSLKGPCGITVQNCKFGPGGNLDGIQTGADGLRILDNEFVGIHAGKSGIHTDAIQLYGSRNTIIRGNYIHDCDTGIMSPDGANHEIIEHNVIDPGTYPYAIMIGSDNGSIIRHNTLPDGPASWKMRKGIVTIGGKAGRPASKGTVVQDNVLGQVVVEAGSSATVNYNLVANAAPIGPQDIRGLPSYAGGAAPTNYAGYALANGSAGTGNASDQADRGIQARPGFEFYLPENPRYTIVESTLDSLRFTLDKTLKRDDHGHLVSISSFVNPQAEVMAWHDFGHLEGPGWAANAVGGAWEIYRWGAFLGKPEWQSNALAILDHVLEGGFLDEQTGFIRGYRETTTGRLVLNYKHNTNWFCPGSMAKVAFQLLSFADDLGQNPRAERMRRMAARTAEWIGKNAETVPNGWFPRRTAPDGKVYRKSPEGGNDPFWQTSADGLFILQRQAALTERALADYRAALRARVAVFVQAGGIFGSINHDTYDPHENVAYSVAFRTLLPISRLLQDDALRAFAYDKCLAGLEQFRMKDDRNGVATKGLLFMEKTWDTAYLWENAEAALAYFEAASDLRRSDPARSRSCELDGLTLLRAIAKHHHGPHGFLTEGVDWNDHVSQKHHIAQAKYGDIQYTEPFLNNQHIAEPTLFYLQTLAHKLEKDGRTLWQDLEGNVLRGE
jgi:hypothetical protein